MTTKTIEELLRIFHQQRPIRGGSLIITVFGDSISQHGGSVWLGSLIKTLEPFGLNQRLVRTAVYRLVQENWLVSTLIGRRSYYSFTEFGLRQYEKTARRIYAADRAAWDGQWTLVLPVFVDEGCDEALRKELRKELRWLGFGALTPGLLAHPGADRRSLDETLRELGLEDNVVVMNAHTEELASQGVLKRLALTCWDLDKLESRYEGFLSKFRPVFDAFNNTEAPQPAQCFQLRTLMIHEYRRILLKDTDLPDDLLPTGWAGQVAYNLTADIYRATSAGAEQYVRENMEDADGPLPAATAGFYQRFGGL